VEDKKILHEDIFSWTSCGELDGALLALELMLSMWIETICFPGTMASPNILGSVLMFCVPDSQAARELADICSAQQP